MLSPRGAPSDLNMNQTSRSSARAWPILVVFGAVFLSLIIGGALHLALRVAQMDTDLSVAQLTAAAQRVAESPETLLFGIGLSATTTLVAGGTFLRWGLSAALRPRWDLPPLRLLGAMVVVGLCLSQVASVLTQAATELFPRSSLAVIEAGLNQASGPTYAGIILGLVVAALGEELLFRGAMLSALTASWGPRWALWVTSALFGLLHFDPLHSTFAVVFGVYLGWVVQRTRSLAPAVLVHAVNNLIAGLSARGSDSGMEDSWVAGGVAGMLCVVGLAFLQRALPRSELPHRPSSE